MSEASQWVPSSPAGSGTGLCPTGPPLLQIALLLLAVARGGRLQGCVGREAPRGAAFSPSPMPGLVPEQPEAPPPVLPHHRGLATRLGTLGTLGSGCWEPSQCRTEPFIPSAAAPEAAEVMCWGSWPRSLAGKGWWWWWRGVCVHGEVFSRVAVHAVKPAHGSNSPPSPPLWISRST